MPAEEPKVGIDHGSVDGLYRRFPSFDEWSSSLAVTAAVEEMERSVLALDRLKSTSDDRHLSRIREEMMRAAAWDTGAIENLYTTDRGVTYSVAQQTATWEAEAAGQGDDALELFQAQLEAYEFVLDLVTKSTPFSEATIRRIHEIVTEPQQTYRVFIPEQGWAEKPLMKGGYKTEPNHVMTRDGSPHAYAPVLETEPEMARLIDEVRTDGFRQAHAAVQAAYVHYAFVAIHPFSDGNGRVARAIGSVFTYRAASVPLYVFADEKERYFECLAAADAGNYTPFTEFVLHWTMQAVTMMRHKLAAASVSTLDESAQAVRGLLHARGGLSHLELDQLIEKLRNHLASQMKQRLDRADLGAGVTGAPSLHQHESGAWLEGYRGMGSNPKRCLAFNVNLRLKNPVECELTVSRVLMAASSQSVYSDIAVVAPGADEPELGLMVADVLEETQQVELTTAAEFMVDAWASRLLNEALAQFHEMANAKMRDAGWFAE